MNDLVTIKLKIPRELLERLDALAATAGMSRSDFVRSAIEAEVKRREIEKIREDIAILEIDSRILKDGQSVRIDGIGDPRAEQAGEILCELCHTSLPAAAGAFQGPKFCEDCLALAKGGDFSSLQDVP